ncbi:leucine-rich repeat- and IQ domain-containing protein 1 [Ctenodactylus gundi]
MEDSDIDDAKLREEIEAELDKVSISSLEKEESPSDSKSETQSDGSDVDADELPESVLHCINIIKNRSKTAEALILQGLDDNDTDAFRSSYGAVAHNHVDLRIGLSTHCKENSEQLMKVLSGIETEQFMRTEAQPAGPEDASEEPVPQDAHAALDDADINFGYFEVEERCRQSLEAWQNKQKELEDKEKETLKAQKDREEKQFQEEEEKRHFWMKQFEAEKKKLENLYKQEAEKMNDELHKEEEIWKEKYKQHEEFIRNLHLKMEEERTRFKELQEKEAKRVVELRYSAAVKIQAKYRAFITYQKYVPIIREQIEAKRRRAQEWKETEAKIRQKEEETQKRLEEELKTAEEIKKQKKEERKEREKEYEEKKNILRQEREELRNKGKLKLRENTSKQLIMGSTLNNKEYGANHLTMEGDSVLKRDEAKTIVDENIRIQEEFPLSIVEKSRKRENVETPPVLKELAPIQLKSSQTILTELKMEETSEDLAKKQCSKKLVREEIKCDSTNMKPGLENLDQKENVNEQFQMQELNSLTLTEECSIEENAEEQIQKMLADNQEMAEVDEALIIIRDNQQQAVPRVEKEEISEQSESLYEENSTLMNQNQLPRNLENSEPIGGNTVLQEKVTDTKSKATEENSKTNTINNGIAVFNTAGAGVDIEGKIHKEDADRLVPREDSHVCNAENCSVNREGNTHRLEIKEVPEKYYENRAGCQRITPCSMSESPLLSSIEEKRLAWIKSFKPWSEISKENQQRPIIKRKRPVKYPANTMPPLSLSEILQCGPWNNFQQVTTVAFQDLPGCSLTTLAECVNLQFLSLRRCGLTCLSSLSNCKKLKCIDAQENNIETINCENLENLCVVVLNKNQLTSVHGLDGCTNIQNLELSHNKITRIGGLESLKSLQRLIVDHNQLISTKGLCDTPTITYLDCSYNHLTNVDGIGNCALLQTLKLQGNNLTEPPSLKNHVLLRELHLDDNSISTMEAFSSFWLPLLQNLTISQNSLTKIVPLFHLVSLEKLDVSNNCLSDLKSAVKWFDACYSLRELSLTGNPLLQETNWRNSLLKMLPALRVLNSDVLSSYAEIHTEEQYQLQSGPFLLLCQSQIREFKWLINNYITGKREVVTLETAENLCHYFKKLMSLSNEYRNAHECGDVSIIKKDNLEARQNHLACTNNNSLLQNEVFHSSAGEHSVDSHDISEKLLDSGSSHSPLRLSSACNDLEERNQQKLVGQKREDSSKTGNTTTSRTPLVETADSTLRNHSSIKPDERIMAAVVIQAYWRGYIARRQIHFGKSIRTAATETLPSFFNNQTTFKKKTRENMMNIKEQKEKAAVLIQAVWKGFILRKKLTVALEAIKNEETEDEYEEINLEDFTFSEAALEKEWLALDPTRFPTQTLLLSNQLCWPKISGPLKYDDTAHNLQTHPAQAWLCNEQGNVLSSEHTQSSSRSENRALSGTPESKTSKKSLLKSEKEEKISEEWGFKDISTAQQMLKRARKMKSKKLKKKLDPAVRLAVFKKNENRVCAAKSPQKAHSGTDDDCEGKNDLIYDDATENETLERRKEYTYQWLHTQVGVHDPTSSRNMKCSHFLPELDPDVLNGGRVQLVARLVSREDTDLDLFSMTSGSALSVNREKKTQPHKHSAGSSSYSIEGILSPMTTNTRPSKKERMSFRDNPLQLSGGWGRGKKKARTSK